MRNRVPPGPKFPAINVVIGQIIKSRQLTPMQFFSFFPPFGDISYWEFGDRKLYFLNHPDLIREVLVEKAASYRKNELTQKGLRPFLGEGLLLSLKRHRAMSSGSAARRVGGTELGRRAAAATSPVSGTVGGAGVGPAEDAGRDVG